MKLVKYKDPTHEVLAYPYSYHQMRLDFYNVSFPREADLTAENLTTVPVAFVVPTEQPVYNSITQSVGEVMPIWIEGEFRQAWLVEDLEQAQIDVNIAKRQRDCQLGVQRMLDAKVRERNYDNILSACTYVNSPYEQFAAEGAACIAWRDACWVQCYQILAEVQSGQRPVPTVQDVLNEMPLLTWPA